MQSAEAAKKNVFFHYNGDGLEIASLHGRAYSSGPISSPSLIT